MIKKRQDRATEVRKNMRGGPGEGGTHSVRNTGEEDLVITAVIMQY